MKFIGIINDTGTFLPLCFPGSHFGNVDITLNASATSTPQKSKILHLYDFKKKINISLKLLE